MQNIQINPTTKDYVVVNGSPVPSDRVLESAFYALMIPQNTYLYIQPNQGSLINTLRQKRDSSVEQKFASYAQDALKRQLINTGLASDDDIYNISTSAVGTSNQIDIVPKTTQLSNVLNFVSVG